MNNTWIKLYRKLLKHDIIRDATSLQIFIWILISVDYETGQMYSGRFWASQQLGLKPSTFHKALKRIEEKYDLVTLSSDNKKTSILVKNWDKYQMGSDTYSNNKVTTKEQQSNNKVTLINNKEVNNKEIINIYIKTYNELFNKSARPTKGRENKLLLRIKTYSFEDILEALNNLATSEWHKGKNDRGWIADPDFLIRSDEQIDKWVNYQKVKNKGGQNGKPSGGYIYDQSTREVREI